MAKVSTVLKTILISVFLSVIPTLLIWLPFFFRLEKFWNIPLPTDGMATIVANYDGPLYIVVAKSFYNPEIINTFSFTLPSSYYAAHFPLYPALIKLAAGLFGYPYSMLLVTLVSSVLAVFFFHKFISDYVDKKDVLWLTFVFSIFPARWLIVRSVGSAEPLFIAGIIASLYYFKKEKYLFAGIWGAIAGITKSPGILLFVAYFIALAIPIFNKLAVSSLSKQLPKINVLKYLPLLLIPAALVVVFYIYKIQLNDFLAYFHSGDNIHLFFPPFQIFNYSASWVGTFWLEEVIFVYLLGGLGFIQLVKQKESAVTWFVGIFFASVLFVSHRDIIRYALPIVPFLIAGFSKYLVTKEFKYAMALILIPIYLFAIAYISNNVMPISDWAPLL